MISCFVIEPADAQQAIMYCKEHHLFHTTFAMTKHNQQLYIPIIPTNQQHPYTIIEVPAQQLQQKRKGITLKDMLSAYLTPQQIEKVKTSFDVIGTIAIIEVDDDMQDVQQAIAQCILDATPGVQTVVKKKGIHQGTYRTQDVIHLAGIPTTITTHKESGVLLTLDITTVYFSPRQTNERMRIAQAVQAQENVAILFNGCAPFACVLSKHSPAHHIVGIELNPKGHTYAKQNIAQNHCTNVEVFCDDATNLSKYGVFDRIVMPLPKNAKDFLPTTLQATKQATTLHIYDFLQEHEFEQARLHIQEICQQQGYNAVIVHTQKCGHHAPYTFRVCFDVVVKKS